jgi:hypothetical protein
MNIGRRLTAVVAPAVGVAVGVTVAVVVMVTVPDAGVGTGSPGVPGWGAGRCPAAASSAAERPETMER